MTYSHPNDTKRIELLKEAVRWSKLFIEELEQESMLDLDGTYKSEVKRNIDSYEQFEADLKKLEDSKQLSLFDEVE